MDEGLPSRCRRWAWAAVFGLMFGLAAQPLLAAGLTLNGDGTATDSDTALVWDQCAWGWAWNGPASCTASTAETFAWADALGAAVAANASGHRGYRDWRLPSKNELESLVNIDATTMPAIDPLFPWPYAAAEFWTSTTYLTASASAWCLDFQNGGAAPCGKEKLLRVRLVRGGRPSAGFDILDDVAPPFLLDVGVSGIGRTGATLTATSNETATGYWILVARNAAAPTATDVQAGVGYGAVAVIARGNGGMTAATATSFAIANLSAGTNYDLWLVAEDANTNFSALEKVPFATPADNAEVSYGPIPTRKNGVTALLTVAGCAVIDTARFIDAPTGGPAGMSFPYGLLEFTASQCDATAPVTVTYSEPLPNGTYYKEVAGAYSPFQAAVDGNRIFFTLTDNGAGDDHPAAGTIRDPSGLAVVGESIPALGPWTLGLLSALLGLLGLHAVQRTG